MSKPIRDLLAQHPTPWRRYRTDEEAWVEDAVGEIVFYIDEVEAPAWGVSPIVAEAFIELANASIGAAA